MVRRRLKLLKKSLMDREENRRRFINLLTAILKVRGSPKRNRSRPAKVNISD